MDWMGDLSKMLAESGAKVTFSAYCRSGLHSDCRCERCCRAKYLPYDEARAVREAKIADQAFRNGFALGSSGKEPAR